jgi:hypothetical protein
MATRRPAVGGNPSRVVKEDLMRRTDEQLRVRIAADAYDAVAEATA